MVLHLHELHLHLDDPDGISPKIIIICNGELKKKINYSKFLCKVSEEDNFFAVLNSRNITYLPMSEVSF